MRNHEEDYRQSLRRGFFPTGFLEAWLFSESLRCEISERGKKKASNNATHVQRSSTVSSAPFGGAPTPPVHSETSPVVLGAQVSLTILPSRGSKYIPARALAPYLCMFTQGAPTRHLDALAPPKGDLVDGKREALHPSETNAVLNVRD